MAETLTKRIIIVLSGLLVAIQKGLSLLIKNLMGTVMGGIAGYFIHKQYEAGLLLQREMSRAFSILGLEHEVILRMTFFILLFAYIGAIIQNKLAGRF